MSTDRLSPVILAQTVGQVMDSHPFIAEFFSVIDARHRPSHLPLAQWLQGLSEEFTADFGMDRDQIARQLAALIHRIDTMGGQGCRPVRSLTIIGGRNKLGQPEDLTLTLTAGDIVCIVGPTGAGKSRLLADIECLAQQDTPTGRRLLVNDETPTATDRFAMDRKLVAQLSQNMNFVVDLSVGEFIDMHARCRMVTDRDRVVDQIIACANELAGEKFSARQSVTQLSGGQARALMVADTALLSASPVVLIDEIENAGVNRKKALDLLVREEKIVLISTHDPLLALMGQRRIVIRNGGIHDIIETSDLERQNLKFLESFDYKVMELRDRLRNGERIEVSLQGAIIPAA